MKKNSSFLSRALTFFLILTVFTGSFLFTHLLTPVSFNKTWKEVEIPEGSSYAKGIDILLDNGILNNKFALLLLGKITGSEKLLKPGYYYLSSSMSPLQIFDDLIKGKTIQYSVTIPEGSTLKDIKKRLVDLKLMDDDGWQLAYDEDFLSSLNINAPTIEGYLYPDTYSFSKGTAPEIIFKIMVQRLREIYNEPLRARAKELNMTENDVLTLASIIEKEAVFDSERPLISAVYHNRLKKNMKLQADPTVLYGVKRRWKRIRYKDLKRSTPYNTYVIKGLPPGPIASPGEKSIRAALYPADVTYMFFVSKNDGTHYFSSSGEEHVKAVNFYQVNGGKDDQDVKEAVN
jgi:UPF0755 protein